MKRRVRKPIEKNPWLITYADMVTLLLCFFILMFAASSLDINKWQVLVKNLNPNASITPQVVNEMSVGEQEELPGTSGSAMMAEVDTFDELYQQMDNYVQQNNLQDDVEVYKGNGYTFITFKNNIFFDGDQYDLKPQGKEILDFLCTGLESVTDSIREMKVMGHTNQADPSRPNDPRGDRFLASNRATEVLTYIQLKDVIAPKKLVAVSYGQHYPIAPFVEESDRIKNRRVEILITENEAVDITLDKVYQQISNN